MDLHITFSPVVFTSFYIFVHDVGLSENYAFLLLGKLEISIREDS